MGERSTLFAAEAIQFLMRCFKDHMRYRRFGPTLMTTANTLRDARKKVQLAWKRARLLQSLRCSLILDVLLYVAGM